MPVQGVLIHGPQISAKRREGKQSLPPHAPCIVATNICFKSYFSDHLMMTPECVRPSEQLYNCFTLGPALTSTNLRELNNVPLIFLLPILYLKFTYQMAWLIKIQLTGNGRSHQSIEAGSSQSLWNKASWEQRESNPCHQPSKQALYPLRLGLPDKCPSRERVCVSSV